MYTFVYYTSRYVQKSRESSEMNLFGLESNSVRLSTNQFLSKRLVFSTIAKSRDPERVNLTSPVVPALTLKNAFVRAGSTENITAALIQAQEILVQEREGPRGGDRYVKGEDEPLQEQG